MAERLGPHDARAARKARAEEQAADVPVGAPPMARMETADTVDVEAVQSDGLPPAGFFTRRPEPQERPPMGRLPDEFRRKPITPPR